MHQGVFYISEGEEIGEGGLALRCSRSLAIDTEVVVSFRIPGGDFVSLRAEVKSVRPHPSGENLLGIAFTHIAFTHKRQIRSFVSERTERESVG